MRWLVETLISGKDKWQRFHPFLGDAGAVGRATTALRPKISQFYAQLVNRAEPGNFRTYA